MYIFRPWKNHLQSHSVPEISSQNLSSLWRRIIAIKKKKKKKKNAVAKTNDMAIICLNGHIKTLRVEYSNFLCHFEEKKNLIIVSMTENVDISDSL